ncbi:probable E3 ubiquitin-protein ligase ZFP1 [Impatiens glandulifera]|uniref:probable E3 ubiquitin-protein ligase ZFP1 n=1 Tax=Impatiens glandulifera TaxID=253017 RepID=UPI001FB132CB|nr:probable E3 ubiquitin-protein ligase ZFP1 [Impatiens glandulifera]
MGHRHGFTPSHVFEIDNDQSWNHVHQERSYNQPGSENGSVVYPVQNVHADGVNYGSYWNPVPRSNGFASSSQMNEMPHYQHVVPPHGAVTSNLAPNNYTHNASSSSSSSHGGHTFSGAEGGGSMDTSMTSNRGPYKRKSPANPPIYEGSSANRYYSAGNSSNVYGLSIGGDEGTMRNVRSRPTVDLGTNIDRNLPTNPQHHHSFLTNYISDQSTTVEHFGQGSNASMQELNNQGRIMMSDANISSQDNNHFIVGSSTQSPSADSVGYHNDFSSSRPPIPHNITSQPSRGARSSYDQRSAPAFRPSSSNLRLGYNDNRDEGLQLVAGNHSSRQHSRGFSSTGWRNNERSGRTRVSSDRYRSFHHDHMSLHEQFSHQGLMVADRSGFYGSRNLNDQHRDLRLDIENMSYEELLALGERIGHVNTGLSENMVTKSLTVSVYCSSDHCQEELKCVICLEEYKNMDEVAKMKTCKHDFHVNCIKKWLSMKNMCPICKTSTSMASDHLKKEQ